MTQDELLTLIKNKLVTVIPTYVESIYKKIGKIIISYLLSTIFVFSISYTFWLLLKGNKFNSLFISNMVIPILLVSLYLSFWIYLKHFRYVSYSRELSKNLIPFFILSDGRIIPLSYPMTSMGCK